MSKKPAKRKPTKAKIAKAAAKAESNATPERTAKKEALSNRLIKARFKPGQSGNPSGRPPGSRNKLCGRFIEDLHLIWVEQNEQGNERGLDALRELAKTRPGTFVMAVGNLVPREFDVGEKTEAGFKALWEAMATGMLPMRNDEDSNEAN